MATSRSLGSTSFTTRSPMETVPSVTSSSPATRRSAVVLPQPDEPSSTSSSPSATCSVRSSTAVVSPNRLVTPSKLTCANVLPSPLHGRCRPRPSIGQPHGSERRDRRHEARSPARAVDRLAGIFHPMRLGDLLARRAQPVALGVAPGHPLLAAQGPHGRAVDDALHDARAGGDELPLLALLGRVALQDDVGHPVVVALVELRARPGRGQGRPAVSPSGARDALRLGISRLG